MNKILNIFADCIPLFGGLFVVTSRPAPIDLSQYLALYLIWLLSTLVWSFVCNVISALIPSETDTTYKSALRVLILFCVILFVGVLMVLLHYRANVMVSQTILILLLLLAASYRFQRSQQHNLVLLTIVPYQIIACLLSFQLVITAFDWQSIVYSIGFGLITSSLRLSQTNPKHSQNSLTIGALVFSSLALLASLPKTYLFPVALIALQNWASNKNLWLRCLPAALFIAMLTVLAFI
jgi:hypothetical protein